jgi:hypothetical protein
LAQHVSSEKTTAFDNHTLVVVLQIFILGQNLPNWLVIVKHVVSLTVVLNCTQRAELAKSLANLLPVVLLLAPSENYDLAAILLSTWGELGSNQRDFARKPGVEYTVISCGLAEDKSFLFTLIEAVQHGNEGTTSHIGVISSFVTCFFMKILFNMLEIDVGIGLEEFFVEN